MKNNSTQKYNNCKQDNFWNYFKISDQHITVDIGYKSVEGQIPKEEFLTDLQMI